MQVILGSGGSIARPLTHALAQHTDHVRCVSRTPHALPREAERDEATATTHYQHVRANLLDPDAVLQAVQGAEVAYLTAGLPYDSRIWRKEWPVLIDNVIEACAKTGAKLAFFDNVYSYAASSYGHMT